jgi:hypothetical protein
LSLLTRFGLLTSLDFGYSRADSNAC